MGQPGPLTTELARKLPLGSMSPDCQSRRAAHAAVQVERAGPHSVPIPPTCPPSTMGRACCGSHRGKRHGWVDLLAGVPDASWQCHRLRAWCTCGSAGRLCPLSVGRQEGSRHPGRFGARSHGATTSLLRDEAPPGVATLVGGCDPFTVFAQNRWTPLGTAVRDVPTPTAKKIKGFSPNELIGVDGWVRTRAPYPSNTPPWTSDVWFHLSHDSGWVSFAGVRADPTSPDPTGHDADGGRSAPTPDECSGSVRS
jgi:hypothetical protein